MNKTTEIAQQVISTIINKQIINLYRYSLAKI